MKKFLQYAIPLSLFAIIAFYSSMYDSKDKGINIVERIKPTSSPAASLESKRGREDYFDKILRDPATNKIPQNIRSRELVFAKDLEKKNKSLLKSSNINELSWKEAGPIDVGGRTRALAIDVNNKNTIIAGGVAGGIWKSTDNGATWQTKSTTSQILSVTSLAQDKRSGNTNTWYYASGEKDGSAQDLGYTAYFTGGGIYKSVDNGETWNLLANAKDTNPSQWNTPFDYVSKIIVNPATGSVFITSHAYGILKSADGGNSFSLSLGGANEHIYSDIDIAANGTIVAVISSPFQGVPSTNTPGVYKSTNDGQNWTSITPNSYPEQHLRSVVAIAPSNTNVCYVMTNTGNIINDKIDDIRFHKINISNGTGEDRSANMPNFEQDFSDFINTQRNYNMVVAVKPDNENFVMIAGTSLFRSTNGFATKPNDMKLDWIGGYNLTYFSYPNFHSDVHSFAFDPTNPKAMWWGNDGGLAYTSDITNTSYAEIFPWITKNNGYNVTQFYMVTQPKGAGDNRIMGGTQDNGSPFFTFDGNSTSASEDVSSGDGSYAYMGDSFCYTSAQEGAVLRVNYDGSGNASRNNGWSNITPQNAKNQSFINPYVVDPNDEDIMLYPAGSALWRNNQLSTLPVNASFAQGITQGWTELTSVTAPDGFIITALAISESNPQHRLYYGASNFSQTSQAPKVFRLDNANTATNGAVELTLPGVADNSYIHNIALNPDNADEVIVVMSNYNITGIYHSSNGGQTFTAVEGNLTGDENNPGPSIRAACLLGSKNGTQYFVATSTGIYSTSQLNGNNTNWFLEGSNTVGNVIVSYLSGRKSDGRIVAGTHGRGAFVAKVEVGGAALANVDVSSLTLHSKPGQTGNTSFILNNTGESTLTYNISVNGNFSTSLSKIDNVKYVLEKADLSSSKFDEFRMKSNFNKTEKILKISKNKSMGDHNSFPSIAGNDFLFLDDGDASSDDFVGWGDGKDFNWYNEFNVSGFDFEMDSFNFYLRTEQSIFNNIYAAIYDQDFNLLSEGTLSLSLSSTGTWYTITLNPKLTFTSGKKFYIELYSSSFIPFPAGTDKDAQIKNKSFYYDGTVWINLNTISGFENGAFLIRASGTKSGGGGGNQSPIAIANISKTQADVNETITFDGSQSFDNDGQISQYLWNFGDGTTSAQQTISHSYSQANTYNYSLKVTDNQGATNQKTGQIIVSAASTNYVTVSPESGSIQPGASQTINLTLNGQTLKEGTYTGQVTISTNGGNINIPIDYLVDVEQTSKLPQEFSISQNYPNPFNPTTIIEFSLPKTSEVTIKVYDMLGKEIFKLVDEQKSAGKYKINFDASSLASGIYFYKIIANNFSQSRKMLLLK